MTVNPFTARAAALSASVSLPRTFPITTFVATNPLHGLEHRTFEDAARITAAATGARSYLSEQEYEALHSVGRISARSLHAAAERGVRLDRDTSDVRTLTELVDAERGTDLALRVDAVVATWCAAYLDEGQASWTLPDRDLGLYGAWRRLAPIDPALARLAGRKARRRVHDLPENGAQALSWLIERRRIPGPRLADYFRAAYRRLPGWASALARSGDSDDLVAYLALRLALEDLVLDQSILASDPPTAAASDERHEPIERLAVWQEALELDYRDHLLGALSSAGPGSAPSSEAPPPDAQAVFCIDVRSEGIRRNLEAVGRYETIGFAGFFGLPIRVATLEHEPVASCPVILEPQGTVVEVPDTVADRAVRAHDRHDSVEAARHALHDAKTAAAAPFAFAEAAGWLLGPLAAMRTFAPRTADRLAERARRTVEPPIPTRMRLDRVDDPEGQDASTTGFSEDEQVAMARAALTTMSLTSGFAPLVLLCGHRSSTTNNPYAAALDCGACAGKPGGSNARVLAELLNSTSVRAGLADAGITIPAETCFVAAEHDTTTDAVRVLDRHRVPSTHEAGLARLEGHLDLAGRRAAAERQRGLPGAAARVRVDEAARRAADWAEPVAEWGLVGNSAVVVGPRSLTAGCDLERRVFLHSYEPDQDPDGLVLGAILTGPLLVGHWISSQYYFSAVDPERFGAGTKPLHNPVAGLGVYEGAGGDLRIGLPLESVAFAGRRVHEPLRLLAVVQAPRDRLERLIDRHPAVAQLLRNGWVRLVAGSNGDDGWAEYRRDGTWEPWTEGSVPEVGAPMRHTLDRSPLADGDRELVGATSQADTKVEDR